MQTAGTLTVLVGLLVGVFAAAYHSGQGPSNWAGEASPYVAAVLVVAGIILSIVGRVRNDKRRP